MAWDDQVIMGTPIQNHEFVGHYDHAVWERTVALASLEGFDAGTYAASPVDGDRIQRHDDWIAGMQETIVNWMHEDNTALRVWVRSHDAWDSERAQASVDSSGNIEMWTWATLREAAGMGSHFKRTLADGSVAYDFHQRGDKHKAHLYEELRRCLLMLRWSICPTPNNEGAWQRVGQASSSVSAEDAEAAAMAAYTEAGEDITGGGAVAYTGIQNADGFYSATVLRARGVVSVDTSEPPCARRVDAYGKVTKYGGDNDIFSAQGDPVAEDEYRLLSASPSVTDTHIEVSVGHTDPDSPPSVWASAINDGVTRLASYMSVAEVYVIRWSFSE